MLSDLTPKQMRSYDNVVAARQYCITETNSLDNIITLDILNTNYELKNLASINRKIPDMSLKIPVN